MGTKIASLEIELAMATGRFVEGVGIVDKGTAQIIRDVQSVDKALANMGGLDPLTSSAVQAEAQLTKAADAARKTAQEIREYNRATNAGEGASARLERDIQTYGMTRQEIRALRNEEKAAAADRVGNHQLAAQIRQLEAELFAKEYADIRRNSEAAEAAAQDKADAAARAVQAAEREATALREAAHAHMMFEARVREGAAALREQEAAEGAAAAAATRLRASIDPLWAAEQRLERELREIALAEKAGVLSTDLLSAAQKRARREFDETTNAIKRQTGAGGGLSKNQRQTLLYTASDIVGSSANGINPMQLLIQQGPQVLQAFAAEEGGLAKILKLVNPVTIGIGAVTAATIVGAAAWLSYRDNLGKLQALAQGSGRVIGVTGEELEANAEAAAKSGNMSVNAAREIETGYVQMGGIGKNVLRDLTSMTRDFAKATGQDTPAAMQQLGAAMQDPAKGAEDLTVKFGALDQKTIEHIQSLADANDKYGAQAALLDALRPAFDGAADHANVLERAWDGIANAAAGAWNWIGKAIDRALGGGTAAERLGDLYKQRDRLLSSTMGMGDTSYIDKQIAQMKAALEQVDTAAARSKAVGVMKDVSSITGEDALGGLQQRLAAVNGLLADNGKAAGLSAQGLASARQAQDALDRAVRTYIPAAQKQQELDAIDARMAAARSPAAKAALAAQRERIQLSGQIITQGHAEAAVATRGAKVLAEASRAGETHAEALARAAARRAEAAALEAAAVEAQIRNSYKLADAYDVSDVAALKAEARLKAESEAIKKKGDVELFYGRQLRLMVAERVRDAAKIAADLNVQATAQEAVNGRVTAGLLPSAEAADALRDELALRPLIAAIQIAEGDARDRAIAALERQEAAQSRFNAAARAARQIDATRKGGDDLADLRAQLAAAGEIDSVRERAIVRIKAEREALALNWAAGSEGAKAYVAQQLEIYDTQQVLNGAISHQADLFDAMRSNAEIAAQGMADAFGDVGQAIGDMTLQIIDHAKAQQDLDRQRAADLKNASGIEDAEIRAKKIWQVETLYAEKTRTAQIHMFGDIASAAKGLFDERSKAYKVLATAEQAFRAVELAMAIKSAAVQLGLISGVTTAKVASDATMAASDTSRSAVEIANSVAAGAAKAAEAVVNAIRSLPFPLNIAAGAATAAVVASLGFAVAGAFGGGSKNDLQKPNDGTGTVLGEAAAKSESLLRSIDMLRDIDDATLGVSRGMLSSLRSIDDNIGGLATLLVRTGNLNASAGVKTGFKSDLTGEILGNALQGAGLLKNIPIVGDILGGIGGVVKSLFGSKTSVIASGLLGGPQAIADVLNAGFDASYFSDVKKTKKFLGISTGSSYSTKTTQADAGIEDQFTLLLRQFYETIGQAAVPLGQSLDAVQNRLLGFTVDIGKIDLQGLTGTEIQEKLEAVFGAAADSMAEAAVPGLARFQKVGEGAFETLIRVASTVEQVDAVFQRLGVTSGTMGVDVDMAIAKLFDSVGDFTSAADAYFEAFYSDAEQAAAKSAQLGRAFNGLGLAMPETLAGFRSLVEAQDLTTSAGQQMYATLLQLAPAFADLKGALNGAASAAAIVREREDLQRQLLELSGDTAAIRAAELAKLDVSNRALQSQIWAIQDGQEAAKAAEQLRDAWKSVGDTIMDEVRRIRGLGDATGGNTFASLMGQFNAANSAARTGDMDAAKNLPQLSKSLLDAAAQAATSRQELDRVQAQTAAMLEATYAAIGGLGADETPTNSNTAATLASLSAVQAASGGGSAGSDMVSELRALREVVEGMRTDNNSGHAATASNTGAIKRKLDDVTALSGGDAITIVTEKAAA